MVNFTDNGKNARPKPNTPEFWQQLLDVAKSSDHPIDKALLPIPKKKLEESRKILRFTP